MTIHTTAEVAELNGVTQLTVRNWCRKNGVKNFGGNYIMTQGEVEAFGNRKKTRGPAKK